MTSKPTSTEVIESYINAAEIYLQLEDPDKTIDCLNAAQNPAESYNLGFDVIDKEFEPVGLILLNLKGHTVKVVIH